MAAQPELMAPRQPGGLFSLHLLPVVFLVDPDSEFTPGLYAAISSSKTSSTLLDARINFF